MFLVKPIPLKTGHFEGDFKQMVAGAQSEKVEIPITFFMINHPQGIVLFDAGLGKDYRKQVEASRLNQLVEMMIPSQRMRITKYRRRRGGWFV